MNNSKPADYYLGVDAGGTNCRARLEAADGRLLGSAAVGPATIRRGADFAAKSIKACITETITSAALPPAILANTSLVVGAAGTESSGNTDKLAEMLAKSGLQKISVTSDARTACIGAHGGRDGGIVIVGTGSIGYALIGCEPFRVGGHGFPVSDLGSGAHIGLAAVQQALAPTGISHPPSKFATAILGIIGTANDQIARWSATATATDYAQFAPTVVEHAGKGDTVAKHILANAASHITELVAALHNRGAPRISLMGGLSTIIAPRLDKKIQALLSKPLGDPIDGAIVLARRLQ